MKKFLIITALVALVATPAMALSVVNSKHDMIASGFASATGGAATEVCAFCHTPHSVLTSVGAFAPLWNVEPSADVTSYYGDPGIDTVPGPPGSKIDFLTSAALINATDAKLCLACHDGSMGDDLSPPIFANPPNLGEFNILGTAMSPMTILSLDTMTNDHPTGMNLGANPEASGTNIRTIADITGSFGGDNPFFNGAANTMWCSSCHEVHDNATDKQPFLRKSNVGSALCKACHNK